jgi:predicted acyl esterase
LWVILWSYSVTQQLTDMLKKLHLLFVTGYLFTSTFIYAQNPALLNNGKLDQIEEFSSIITDSVVMPDGIKLMTDVYVPVLQDRLDVTISKEDLNNLLPGLGDIIGGKSTRPIEFLPKGLQLFIYDSLAPNTTLNPNPYPIANPNPYQLPFVFTRTPYNKEGDFVGRIVSIMGYAHAFQDMRGRYSSEGVYMPMLSDSWNKNADHPEWKHILDVLPLNDPRSGNRHEDGYNSIEYIANKLKRYYDYNHDGIVDTFLFCNGSIGMFGASALGNTQYQAAGAHRINPNGRGLKSLLPIVATLEHFNYTGYQNGVFRERIVTGWLRGQIFTGTDDELNDIDNSLDNNIHTAKDYNLPNKFMAANNAIDHFVEIRYPDPTGGVPVCGYYPNSRGRGEMDASRSPVDINGEAVKRGKVVNGVVVDVDDSDPAGIIGFGNSPRPDLNYSRYTNMLVPAYHLTGWWDIFTDGQIQTWSLMKKYNMAQHNPSVPANHKAHRLQKLVIGPWAHQTIGSRESGDMRPATPGEKAPNGQPLPDRLYPKNVTDVIGFDLGNVSETNVNVSDVLKSEIISWFRYNLNYNNYANIGLPKVFIPKSNKWQRIDSTNANITIQVPSQDYTMSFENLINLLLGTSGVNGIKLKLNWPPLFVEQEITVDLPPFGEPILPEFTGAQLLEAIDSVDYEAIPDVRFYVIGPINDGVADNDGVGNYWFGADTFPINNQVTFTDFYLHQNGALNTSPQTYDEGYKVYVHDPNDPIAAIGGANMIVRTPQSDRNSQSQFNLMDPRYAPYGYNRTGIIHYATETLTDTLCVIGFPRVKLYAKTNPDGLSGVPTSTDFIVRILDEYPDGSVYFVTEAVVNARARDFAKVLVHADINNMDSMDIIDNIPFTNITAGEIYEYYFAGMPLAYTWGKGHKLRVMICSSNHTRYQVNPNLPQMEGEFFRRQPADGQTYVFNGEEMEPRVAVQRVAHSDIYQSHLSLPVYQKNVTGVKNVEKYAGIEAEVYPNPSSNLVTVFANRKETLKIRVFNFVGQQVYEDEFNETMQFDVSSFESGMYFIELTNQKGKEKLVKKLTVF